jgi:hypothetical protein
VKPWSRTGNSHWAPHSEQYSRTNASTRLDASAGYRPLLRRAQHQWAGASDHCREGLNHTEMHWLYWEALGPHSSINTRAALTLGMSQVTLVHPRPPPLARYWRTLESRSVKRWMAKEQTPLGEALGQLARTGK